jgi:hypothetical protein
VLRALEEIQSGTAARVADLADLTEAEAQMALERLLVLDYALREEGGEAVYRMAARSLKGLRAHPHAFRFHLFIDAPAARREWAHGSDGRPDQRGAAGRAPPHQLLLGSPGAGDRQRACLRKGGSQMRRTQRHDHDLTQEGASTALRLAPGPSVFRRWTHPRRLPGHLAFNVAGETTLRVPGPAA